MAHVTIIGAGYVGLVTAVCFAEEGHRVTCVEAAEERVSALRQGALPIQEPRLDELWNRHLSSGSLEITGDYGEGLRGSDFVFICVGSPSLPDGRADLGEVLAAARGIAFFAEGSPIAVLKSTVPVGTAARVAEVLNAERSNGEWIRVVSNPEFLREGEAVDDFMHPDRLILGASDQEAAAAVASLYRSVACPVLVCDNATAEMVKYASNAFLATKISFINEIVSLCEPMGVDVRRVAQGMGMDHRIGPHLLEAGLGWGGSCLPKDTKALVAMAEDARLTAPLLSGVMAVNSGLPRQATDRLKALLGRLAHRTVTVWGLTFKPGTDDLRESPSLALLELLVSEECDVRAYDPMVSRDGPTPVSGVTYCGDPYEASRGADAIVLATAWKEFLSLDMSRVLEGMKGRVFFDGRNAFADQNLCELGFLYLGIGRDGVRHTDVAALDGYAANGKISKTRLAAAASRAATS